MAEEELDYSHYEETSAPESAGEERAPDNPRYELSSFPSAPSSSGEKRPSKRSKDDRPNVRRCLKSCEILLVGSALVLIAGLFSLPSVFYAKPSSQIELQIWTAPTCMEVELYSGQICTEALSFLQACYSGVSSPLPALNIPSAVDQQQGEIIVTQLLTLLNPSPECAEREGCLRLRDSVCGQELEIAMSFPLPIPVCEDLPDATDECIGFSTANLSSLAGNTIPRRPNCPNGLFRDQNGTGSCRPECGQFVPLPLVLVIIERISNCVGLIASVIVLILALTIQNSLLKFPTVLLIYVCGTTLVQNAFILVGYFNNTGLFCGSRDQLLAIRPGNETVFCTLSGIIFNYCLQQTFLWSLVHKVFLFWGILFPFSYRNLRKSGRLRYAHISSVILALLLPLPGALVPLKDGFFATLYPTIACIGRNKDHFFHTLVLPISIVLGVISCLLMLTSWTIFKESVIKKLIAGKKVERAFGKAVLKTSGVVLYYIIVGFTILTGFEYSQATKSRLEEVALCKSLGRLDCDDTEQTIFYTFTVVGIALRELISVVVLICCFSPEDCRKIKHKKMPL